MTHLRSARRKRAENMIVDFWAIVVFVFVIIIFFLLFWANRHDPIKDGEAHFRNKDAGVMLNAFLRAPYMYDTKKTVGDVMTQDLVEGNRAGLDKIFDEFYGGIDVYSGGFGDKDYYSSRIVHSISLCVFDEKDSKIYFNEKPVSGAPADTDFNSARNTQCEAVNNEYQSSAQTIIPSYNQNLRVVLNIYHYPKEQAVK